MNTFSCELKKCHIKATDCVNNYLYLSEEIKK